MRYKVTCSYDSEYKTLQYYYNNYDCFERLLNAGEIRSFCIEQESIFDRVVKFITGVVK